MAWYWYVICFVLVLGATYLVVGWRLNHPKKTHVEFKCLEHMCPLSLYNPHTDDWWCPEPGCEVRVDADIREEYEGVRPPT